MGNFTFSEIFTILVVILIVFGPHRLPELARKAGALAAKARSAVDSLKTELDAEYGEVIQPLREARNEMRSAGSEIKGQIAAFGKEVEQVGKEVQAATDSTMKEPVQGLKAATERATNQVAASNALPPPSEQTQANGSVESAAATPNDPADGTPTEEPAREADSG